MRNLSSLYNLRSFLLAFTQKYYKIINEDIDKLRMHEFYIQNKLILVNNQEIHLSNHIIQLNDF